MNLSKLNPAQLARALDEMSRKRRQDELDASRQAEAGRAEAREAAQEAARKAEADKQAEARERFDAQRRDAAERQRAEQDARNLEQAHLEALRDGIESSAAAASLLQRAAADADKYGARSNTSAAGDIRAHDVRYEAGRLFEQVLGIADTSLLWREMEPGISAETRLLGFRWVASFAPGEMGALYVADANGGLRFVPNLAELHRLATVEHPTFFGRLAPQDGEA